MGVRSIPVQQIVGSEGRRGDFDREFLPLRHDIETRWRGVERAFPEGGFPPIVVYKLGDAYFVMDGHHRVAIARQRGMDTVDAEITELVASWHLPADADIAKIIYAEQQRIFNEESGLARARPEALLEFSHARGFIELLENVQIHGYHMMRDRNRALEQEDIAGEWYDRIYLPAVEAIRREGFSEACPDCTDADLFLCLYQRRRNLVPERSGCVPLEEFAGEAAAEDRAKAKRGILRSLLRRGSSASGREG